MQTSLITFLLDRSGSMESCKAATIEAFNAYLASLQAEKDAAIDLTFLQFDTQSLDKVCVASPVASVAPLTAATYQPRGGTPLIDAAVKTINAVADSLTKRDDRPKVVICIQTDGEENASTENTWEGLTALVKQKEAEGWQFNFMGAGIDAYVQGAKMGIGAANTVSYDHTNVAATRSAFSAVAESAASYSAGRTDTVGLSMSARAASGDRHAHKYMDRTGLDLSAKSAPVTPPAPAQRKRAVSDFSL